METNAPVMRYILMLRVWHPGLAIEEVLWPLNPRPQPSPHQRQPYRPLQWYLTYMKTHPPRTLPQAYA